MSKKQTNNSPSEQDFKVTDLTIKQIVPNVIDNVAVCMENGEQFISPPVLMDGFKYKAWRHRKGGIFSKDVNKFCKNKSHGKYILIEDVDSKMIVRLIEDDEIVLFESYKLIDGYIKDKPYMILRKLKPEDSLTSSTVETLDIIVEEDDGESPLDFVPKGTNVFPSEEEVHIPESISLFEG